LLDGQRVVGANVTGVTDVSQFPQLLVKRVDVVTGGASASYGSDAIGGVVNFITDKKFEGFKANVEGGQTTYSDDKNGTVQAAWARLHGRPPARRSQRRVRPRKGHRFAGLRRSRPERPHLVQEHRLPGPPAATNDGKPQYTVIDHAQQSSTPNTA
jgi:iron complex outermembrane receptor protein